MKFKEHKAIHKLQKAGLLEQHNQLIGQGLTNPWFNYHKLKKHNGEIHKVILSYNENQDKKEEKRKIALKTIENMGWLQKHQELVQEGFVDTKKNLKVLLKTNGDVQNSIQKLSKKMKIKFDKPIELIIQEHGYMVQFEKLKEMGYTNEKKIAKLLLKNQGNLEPILDKFLNIKRKDSDSSIRKSIEKKYKFKHYKGERKGKCAHFHGKNAHFHGRNAHFHEKNAHFHGKNFHDKKAMKFISIFNGDVEAAIQCLNQMKPQNQTQGQMVLEQEVLAHH